MPVRREVNSFLVLKSNGFFPCEIVTFEMIYSYWMQPKCLLLFEFEGKKVLGKGIEKVHA